MVKPTCVVKSSGLLSVLTLSWVCSFLDPVIHGLPPVIYIFNGIINGLNYCFDLALLFIVFFFLIKKIMFLLVV